jgi:hypothetical protein
MITAQLRNYLSEMADGLEIPLLRSEQTADRPETVYVSYKLLGGGLDTENLDVQATSLDAENLDVRTDHNGGALVSLTVIGMDYDLVWDKAWEAMHWIVSDWSAEIQDSIGLVVSTDGDVRDRTVYLETEFEYRAGFDMQVRFRESRSGIIPAVDVGSTAEQIFN